jgi:hypothetical protein
MSESITDANSAAVLGLLRSAHKIILAGHSHIVALTGRLKSETLELRPIPGFERIVFYCGPWPRDPDYWLTLRWALPSATIVIFWCGNEHNAHFLLRPEPLFDFVASATPEEAVDDAVQLLPESLVRARLSAFHGELASYLTFLKSATKARVALAGSPPPKGDEARLKQLLLKDWYYRNQAAELGVGVEEMQIAPAPLRRKLWHLAQELMAEAAERHGCSFVPAPAAAFDEEGYLKQELWAEDATHGNALYGRLMLEALSVWFGS